MNSQDTVAAVMAEVQMLRERDRETGQDSRWHGLDAIPDAVSEALKRHGGYIKHEVLSFHQSPRATKKGKSRNYVQGTVRFYILGSEAGEPVTGEVSVETWDSGDPIPKMMKMALRSFLQQTLQLPTDRAEPHSGSRSFGIVSSRVPDLKAKILAHFKGQPKGALVAALEEHSGKKDKWTVYELGRYLSTLEDSQENDSRLNTDASAMYSVKVPRAPKSKDRKVRDATKLPFFTYIHVRANKACMTVDQYAVWYARYYIDAQLVLREPFDRTDLIEALIFEDFDDDEAEYGVFMALMGFGIHGNTTGDLRASLIAKRKMTWGHNPSK
jgi:hypothetical protein